MGTTDWTTLTSVLTAVGGLVVTAFGYVGYQNRRDRLLSIRKSFDDVVASLSGEHEEQRLAGAILLRRFFDETSELGLRTWLPPRQRAPYSQEAISVIAAVLRGLETGNFQKLLADSLAFAPDLKRVDLQKTNLQNAYLVPRRKGVTLERADFYRADLSSASLRGASIPQGIFYQARLAHTVFKGADLHNANFFQADLTNAQFEGARLSGANFQEAHHIPPELVPLLDQHGTYNADQLGPKRISASAGGPSSSSRRIFLSLPADRTGVQQALVDQVSTLLLEQGLVVDTIPRSEYPPSGQLSEVRRRISGCCGVVIFGFPKQAKEHLPRSDTASASPIQHPSAPTPWNHMEASIAFALDLPLLVLSPAGLNQGIFDTSLSEPFLYHLPLESDWSSVPAKALLSEWTSAVLEQVQRGT